MKAQGGTSVSETSAPPPTSLRRFSSPESFWIAQTLPPRLRQFIVLKVQMPHMDGKAIEKTPMQGLPYSVLHVEDEMRVETVDNIMSPLDTEGRPRLTLSAFAVALVPF